ncbi:protein of unknown function [Flexibacter flexilis DSM 6793]|uniref:DUF4905 domain-containing protein n=1 Tax=Flexibacter flexilis DSM 6793 TaxID=927664 RepID=A0A1I1JWX4_9BACT|nr:DUF4905 domain-containing protein [Flexibacter flexilis]SFC53189.1 protein of unknown function [Flexibacter flexilis DSM 6793]
MVLTKKFHYETDGQLWRIVPCVRSGLMAIEVRNPAERLANFMTLDSFSGEFLCPYLEWDGIDSFEDWGIEAVYGGILCLFRYQNIATMPTHEGVWLADMRTGSLLWAQENIVFKEIDTQIHTLRVQLPNTNVLESVRLPDLLPSVAENKAVNLQMPLHYSENNPYTPLLAAFVAEKTIHTPISAFDYLEQGRYIFISYYIRNTETDKGLSNYFLAIDQESGAVLLHLLLAERLAGIGWDTFFVFNQQLFLVVNKTELICYELNL